MKRQEEIREGYNNIEFHGISEEYYVNTVKRLGSLKGEILDVGCGYGQLIKEVLKHNDVKITGVDICDRSVNYCKSQGIDACLGNIEKLPFPDNTFDWVLCSGMIEHVINRKKAIKELYRVLKYSGNLFLSTDNIVWFFLIHLKNILCFWKPKYKKFKQPIDHAFFWFELRNLLTMNGFKILRKEFSGAVILKKFNLNVYKRFWLILKKN